MSVTVMDVDPNSGALSEAEGDAEDHASSVGDCGASVSGRSNKRREGALAQPVAQKRPRYNDKAFAELTITDLENACREVGSLKKQLATREEELTVLREVKAERAMLTKQIRALEGDVAGKEKEAEKLKASVSDHAESVSTQVDRIKKALRQSLAFQMVYCSAFKDQLDAEGREVLAIVPNVSFEVMKALGCEHGTKSKYSDRFFGSPISRTHSGQKLQLSRVLVFKYFKTTAELRVEGTYGMENASKSLTGAAKAKPKAKTGVKGPGKARDQRKSKATSKSSKAVGKHEEEEEDGDCGDDGVMDDDAEDEQDDDNADEGVAEQGGDAGADEA